jgi:hypothetical protein
MEEIVEKVTMKEVTVATRTMTPEEVTVSKEGMTIKIMATTITTQTLHVSNCASN